MTGLRLVATRVRRRLRDGVWSRPDADTVQYRLYFQVRGQVFTGGVLHQFEVPRVDSER